MNDTAQLFAHAQHVGKPGIGELERKARDDQDDEAGKQNQVLPALIGRHARHHRVLHSAPRHCLAAPDDRVVQEHRSNHQQDQTNVNQAAPSAPRCEPISFGWNAILQVHAGQRELLRHALVALAAGGIQIGAIDRRARIARRQNVVHAVATGAVGRNHRTALRGQPVIAVHVARDAVSGHAELLRKPHALMATRARIARNVLLRNRRVGIGVRLDRVNAVAVRAHRRHARCPRAIACP